MIACLDRLERFRSAVRAVRLLVKMWVVWPCNRDDNPHIDAARATMPIPCSMEANAPVYSFTCVRHPPSFRTRGGGLHGSPS